MKLIGRLAIPASIAISTAAHGETPQAVVEFHDFEQGPDVIRKTLTDAWRDDATFRYESGNCTDGTSFTENDGRKDRQPVRITAIHALGDRRLNAHPAYLVSGTRTLWLKHAAPAPLFVDLPCTWLVVFEGNRVESVREATELEYLLPTDAASAE
ncbi:hypothetical protein [Sphingomonas colocasiae]|uniref:Uncharacterized protein n=1 Tax=Sphingomonas colocasiae TaxID=1848973 RepID=A0ABS7PVD6_9SPHN|nr:hypothetical protein [Sphingomonas colocasiae]MBY8825323.1 hypothetical protein [Sphingomonas colocasiae]